MYKMTKRDFSTQMKEKIRSYRFPMGEIYSTTFQRGERIKNQKVDSSYGKKYKTRFSDRNPNQ